MAMATLIKDIDDQFSADVRQKAAVAQLLPQVQGDWHARKQQERHPVVGEARADVVHYFGEFARSEGVYPEADERKLWEDYWLKKLKVGVKYPEPMREYRVRQFANDWWPLMKVFEDQQSPAWPVGPTAETQKAFTTNTLQSLFPIFFDTHIQAGILANPVLERLIMMSSPINSHTATHVTMTEADADATMGETAEGATFIQLVVKEAERTIKLRKFGAEILWTYEAMRLVKLNILALFLQRAGKRYQQQKTDFAISTIIDGDGAGDGAAPTSAATAPGAPVYADLVAGELIPPQGYEFDTIIAPKQIYQRLLTMAEYKDPLAGILHQTTGRLPNPLGMDLIRWDVTGRATTYLATTMLMIDSSLALIEYTEGGLITESEKVMKGQWERSQASEWLTFGVWDHNAAVLLTGW